LKGKSGENANDPGRIPAVEMRYEKTKGHACKAEELSSYGGRNCA